MKEEIDGYLTRLLDLGVIEPVQVAKCGATLIVPLFKRNGSVRICGNLKVSVNGFVDMKRCSLPNPVKLRAALFGCTVLSKVDLADACLQIEVDLESGKYLII